MKFRLNQVVYARRNLRFEDGSVIRKNRQGVVTDLLPIAEAYLVNFAGADGDHMVEEVDLSATPIA